MNEATYRLEERREAIQGKREDRLTDSGLSREVIFQAPFSAMAALLEMAVSSPLGADFTLVEAVSVSPKRSESNEVTSVISGSPVLMAKRSRQK